MRSYPETSTVGENRDMTNRSCFEGRIGSMEGITEFSEWGCEGESSVYSFKLKRFNFMPLKKSRDFQKKEWLYGSVEIYMLIFGHI